MRRAERLYRITDYLRSRRRTTAAWLAERLDVSSRTIYRDIADLIRAGVPIVGEAGVGYALSRRIDLPPLLFDRAELEALAVGIRFVRAFTDDALGDAAERAQAKIRGAVGRDLAEGMRSTAAFVTRRNGAAHAGLDVVLHAVESQTKLALDYRDEQGNRTSRTIRPVAALFSGQAWSIVGWCELREAFRSFRLDRVDSLENTQERFEPVTGRRLEDFFSEMQARHGIATSDFDPER